MRTYVDLDGVLADFDHGARRIFQMEPGEFEQLQGAQVFWKRIAEAPDFYRMLPWTADGIKLWNYVRAWAPSPPIVLTGLPLGDWAEPQKRSWCRRELGIGVPVVCCRSIDKYRKCSPGDILIDDRLVTSLSWEQAGGVFIHHRDTDSTIAALAALPSWPGPSGDPTPPHKPQGA